jgi:Ca2+-binding RTX toxin-like protein
MTQAINLIQGTSGPDTLQGTDLDDSLVGGSGADYLRYSKGHDIYVGGAGNDTIEASAGYQFNTEAGYYPATVQYSAGFGVDHVRLDAGAKVAFDASVPAADIKVSQLVTSYGFGNYPIFVLSQSGTNDKIFLEPPRNDVSVTFADGTTWTNRDLEIMSSQGSSGDDYISGLIMQVDEVHGLGGNDSLSAAVLTDGGEGNDLIEWGATALGGAGDDTINGNGNAHQWGGLGSDTYRYYYAGAALGTQTDISATYAPQGSLDRSVDTIDLSAGYRVPPLSDDLPPGKHQAVYIDSTGSTNDLVISYQDGSYYGAGVLANKLVIHDYDNPAGPIYQFKVAADQTEDLSTFLSKHLTVPVDGTDQADSLYGGNSRDVLHGFAGDDYLDGRIEADTLVGGSGNDVYVVDNLLDQVIELLDEGVDTVKSSVNFVLPDDVENLSLMQYAQEGTGNALDNFISASSIGGTLRGQSGNDTLVAASGNRTSLYGDEGSDLFIASVYAGVATVYEKLGTTTDVDRVKLQGASSGSLVTPDVISVWRGTAGDLNLYLGLKGVNGAAPKAAVIVSDYFSATDVNARSIEAFEFANGVVWGSSDVDVALGSGSTTRLPIVGTAQADSLSGTAGDDTIFGLGGDDTLDGGLGNDQLTGGLGRDVLSGGSGSDVYAFAKGDGQDTIHADAQDAVVLDATMARGDLIVGKLGATAANTVVLGFKNSTDSITLDNVGQWDGLKLSFADGSSLTGADIMAAATKPDDLALSGTAGKDKLTGGAGNDTLTGLAGNDTLAGGLGADKLIGGKGNDTYLFNRGDGKDTIVDTDSTWFNADLLKLGSAKSNQLWLTKSGNNLDIGIIGTQDHVVIQDWYLSSNNRVEKITALGDNKSLSASKVNALVTAMAKFAAPAEGVTTLPASTQTALTKILASSWA